MAPTSLLMKGFGLLVLASLGTASPTGSTPWHARDADVYRNIFARQNNDLDSPSCEIPCDLNSCGAGACGIGSFGSLSRRSFNPELDSLVDGFSSTNETDLHSDEVALELRKLSKRIWRFDGSSKDPVGDREPTVDEADHYIPSVFNGGDRYFKNPLWLSQNSPADERAYSQQVEFKDQPFQIMTGGIHGCMTVFLVSNRAVWAAHFWESYSHRKGTENVDIPATDPPFVDRVLKFIRGEEVTNPAPSDYKPYIKPTGPAPNPDLFNRDTDETRLIISTPIGPRARLEAKNPTLAYPTRVSAMEKAFRDRIGRQPKVYRVPYKRLDYRKPEEKALENQSNRGMHLFQYDPDSDGKGKKAWRVFNEMRYMVKDVITPEEAEG